MDKAPLELSPSLIYSLDIGRPTPQYEISHHFHRVHKIPYVLQEHSFKFAISWYHSCPMLWVLEMASYHSHSDWQRLGQASPRPTGIRFIMV